MADKPHRCDDRCICPVHGTPLIYWPAGDDHACQDAGCQYGHGMRAEENRMLRQRVAGLEARVSPTGGWYHPGPCLSGCTCALAGTSNVWQPWQS
jgi:hypothetical protein